jgi:hypothetical protein
MSERAKTYPVTVPRKAKQTSSTLSLTHHDASGDVEGSVECTPYAKAVDAMPTRSFTCENFGFFILLQIIDYTREMYLLYMLFVEKPKWDGRGTCYY